METTATAAAPDVVAEFPTSTAPTALIRRSPLDLIREAALYLEDLDRVATALCKATILPKAMQSPANLKLVLWQGLAMGFDVIQSIRASFIIESKNENEVPRVGYYADSIVALVRISRVCRFFRVEVSDNDRCRIVCARKDEPENMIHVFEKTLEQARAENLDKKWFRGRGGEWQSEVKYQWQAMPADMLNARVSTRACKRTFQDIVYGMHTREEVDDIIVASRYETQDGFYAIPEQPEHSPPRAAASSSSTSPSSAAAPPATSKPEIVDAEIVEDSGSGDTAWDELLVAIGKHANCSFEQMLPEELTSAWDERLTAAKDRRALNMLAPWIGEANRRAGRSKICSEVAGHFQKTFNDRNAKLRDEERAAKERTAAAEGGKS